MPLSCSRHSYQEPLWEQERTHFPRAHEHALRRESPLKGELQLLTDSHFCSRNVG